MFLFVLLACNEINCDCFFGFAEQRTAPGSPASMTFPCHAHPHHTTQLIFPPFHHSVLLQTGLRAVPAGRPRVDPPSGYLS